MLAGLARRICLLPLLCFLLFAWWSLRVVNNPLRPSDMQNVPDEALLVASNSVRMAMLSLHEAQKNTLPTSFERGSIAHPGPKLERLQASLDNLYRESNLAVGTPGRSPTDMDLCASLAGKRITMIGGEHLYRLHLFLLQHRERAEKKPFPCAYHEFCTHHHICLPLQRAPKDQEPLPRYVKPPTAQELIETESAAVNYIVSDTLFSAPNGSSWEYHLPFVDPATGTRLRETYWLPAARKANVVILGRGPLSAPGETYLGNWSFLHHVPDYVGRSRTLIAAGAYEDHANDRMTPRALDILNAAVHLTVSRFLPDLFRLLQSIRSQVRLGRHKRLIWPSNWYRLPGRGAARTAFLRPCRRSTSQVMTQRTFPSTQYSPELMLASQLSAFIQADTTNAAHLEDPWTLLFNAQVNLQSTVLRELLPQHGIMFLPLNIPWAEGTRTRGHGRMYPADANVDSERTASIGEAFLAGVDYTLRYFE